jgi:uncharacterized protein YdgA (DUF945 family)
MKKSVIAVVVLVLLLGIAPMGIGKLAEKRVNNGLVKLTEIAPYLTVVENKYTTGWFKSEQVVTFELFAPWMRTFNEAMQKEGIEPGDAMTPAESTLPEAAPQGAEPAAVPAKPQSPLRFTVRNEILHGPVLGFSGIGLARVQSQLILSDEVRKEIAEIFGPKEPVEISTRVGFFGGGTTTFKSEGRTIKPKNGKTEISWETAKLAIGYSHDADAFNMDGGWPKIEVKDSSDNTHMVMSNLTLDGDGNRVRGDLYDGDFNFGIDEISVTGKETFELKDLNVAEIVATKGDFTGVSVKMGSGEVKAKELTNMGVALKEIHYDIGVRRLHAPTLEKMVAGMKAMYAKPLPNVADVEQVMFAPLKEQGAELLKYAPEFVIDRIGLVTADGDGYLKGVVALKGATADDFGAGNMRLIPKIHAELTIDVSEKMIQKFPNGSTAAGAGVDSGYVKREGDRLICKILFADGKLTINGKPQAIPGLGGPPAGDPSAEAPPPQ